MIALSLKFGKNSSQATNVEFCLPIPRVTCYRDKDNNVLADLDWIFKPASEREYKAFKSDIEWVEFYKQYQRAEGKNLTFFENLNEYVSQEKKQSFLQKFFQGASVVYHHRDLFKTTLFKAQLEMACMEKNIVFLPPSPPPRSTCQIFQFKR